MELLEAILGSPEKNGVRRFLLPVRTFTVPAQVRCLRSRSRSMVSTAICAKKEKSQNWHSAMRLINGVEVPTFTREITSCNILEVEAGTNGYQGGDTGHGSRTYFRIQDLGSTDIQAHVLGKYGDEGFEVSLGGDCELETVITALKFITKVLEDQSKEVYD